MRAVEFPRIHPLFAPGLDELTVFVELHDARISDCGAAARVPVGDENVAVRCDRDFGGCVEKFVIGGPGDALLAERHQHRAVLVELVNQI